MNKKYLAALAAFIILIGFVIAITGARSATPTLQQYATSSAATPATTYQFTAQSQATVIDAMRMQASSSNFTFKTKEYKGLGAMVEEINGKPSKDGYYWILYVNGTTTSEGASSQKVSPGDVIEWRYEKGY